MNDAENNETELHVALLKSGQRSWHRYGSDENYRRIVRDARRVRDKFFDTAIRRMRRMGEREQYWEARWTDEYYRAERLHENLVKAKDLLEAAYPLISDAIYQPVTKPAIKAFLDKINAGEKKDAENG